MCIIWDVIQRYLRFKGYDVIFVRNITDIDDKIINRAREMGIRPEQVARKYLFEFWRDMEALNIQPPDYEPQATDYVNQMIDFIKGLIEKGKAYVADGDVYFDVGAAKKYGQLTRQNLEDMMAGSRDQVISQATLEARKKHPADFALWKGAPEEESGWMSPWGHGRPGWHLECSTMIKHVLGETIDLHGGGEDLLFPHHENEIAQSEGLHDKSLARFWVHNSFVYVNSEKMAKSLGNFSTIRDVLKDFSADDIRLFVLQTHYRNPIDFTPESLQASKVAMQRLTRAAQYADDNASHNGEALGERCTRPDLAEFHNDFIQAMANDFNTAQTVALLFGLADKIGKTTDATERQELAHTLKTYSKLLGITLADSRRTLKPETANSLVDFVLNLRAESKKRKDYATSDLIRAELTKQGITVMDTPEGATWEVN
jgi:cysteinyl-tRNA synthetase